MSIFFSFLTISIIFPLFFVGGGSLVNSKELEELKAKTATLTSENRELTSALMSCQDELSHMNEKLLLTEDSNIKLKTKLEELAAETEQLLTKTPTMTKSDLEQVLGKIKQLLDVQKDHEKSLAEHDLSRFGDKSTGNFPISIVFPTGKKISNLCFRRF